MLRETYITALNCIGSSLPRRAADTCNTTMAPRKHWRSESALIDRRRCHQLRGHDLHASALHRCDCCRIDGL